MIRDPEDYRSINDEARTLVFGDRGRDYGHPFEDFSRTAEFWCTYKGVEFTADDVAIMMTLLKISRQMFKPKRDNLVDACGYLECAQRCLDCVCSPEANE